VPYIDNDRDGRASLRYPAIFQLLKRKQNAEDGAGIDAPSKVMNEIPEHTTYYFSRWMWIHYPYIALGNANQRFELGLNQKNQVEDRDNKSNYSDLQRPSTTSMTNRSQSTNTRSKGPATIGRSLESFAKTWTSQSNEVSSSVTKLPEISHKFHRKVARSVRKVPNHDTSDPMDEISHKLMFLQDDIQAYRDECDFLGQLKSTLDHKLFELKGQLIDLERTEEATHNFDDALTDISKREKESAKRVESVKILNKNLKCISTMCERHPASFPSAIEDLKNKCLADDYLLHEIKQRLWEQKFERQTHEIYFKQMKELVAEGMEMQRQLLQYRVTARKNIAHQAQEDEKKIKNYDNTFLQNLDVMKSRRQSISTTAHGNRRGSSMGKNHGDAKQSSGFQLSKNQPKSWEETWSIISMRTGITEPEIFFHRFNNGKMLEDQMNYLKKQSDNRVEMLKREVLNVEAELEETRYAASFVGGQSIKEQQKMLMDKQFVARHYKERAEATEQLQQKVVTGLVHLGEMLGIQPRDDDSPITDLQRDIEAVLDTLIDEREKQIQQQGQPHTAQTLAAGSQSLESFSRSTIGNLGNNETHHRTPELDFIISKFEAPKVRLPDRIPSKTVEAKLNSSRGSDDEDDTFEEGTWDRSYVKSQSLKSVRIELKKAARQTKPEGLVK
jgi:hypothetical protein